MEQIINFLKEILQLLYYAIRFIQDLFRFFD